MLKKWTKELNIAIMEENMEKIMLLADNIPETKDVKLAQEACNLIEQAINLANKKKLLLRAEMNKLKTVQKYFK